MPIPVIVKAVSIAEDYPVKVPVVPCADTLTTGIGLHRGSDLNSWTGLFSKVWITRGWDFAMKQFPFRSGQRVGGSRKTIPR